MGLFETVLLAIQVFETFLTQRFLNRMVFDPCSTCVLDDDTVEVTVSEVNSPLNAEEMEGLRENVNPLTISSEYGVDLFLRAACYVAERIGQR